MTVESPEHARTVPKPSNTALQTDERRVLVMANLLVTLAPLAAERQSR